MLMAKKRINVSELHRETGVSRTLLTLMHKNDVSRVDIESLNTLCEFFECTVHDLLTYEKDNKNI